MILHWPCSRIEAHSIVVKLVVGYEYGLGGIEGRSRFAGFGVNAVETRWLGLQGTMRVCRRSRELDALNSPK